MAQIENCCTLEALLDTLEAAGDKVQWIRPCPSCP